MSHITRDITNRIPGLTLVRRVNEQYDILNLKEKKRAKTVHERAAKERRAKEEFEKSLKRFEERAKEAQKAQKDLHKNPVLLAWEQEVSEMEAQERYERRQRERTNERGLRVPLCNMVRVGRIKPERVVPKIEKIDVEKNLQEEFNTLLQIVEPETLRQALELGGIDLSQNLSWEVLNELQDAIEVALEL